MLDIKFIRQNADKVKWAAEVKNVDCDVDRLLAIDGKLLAIRRELQDIQTTKNASGKRIPKAPPDEKQKLIAEMTDLKKREKELEAESEQLQPQYDKLMLAAPQVPADDAPIGQSEADNVELRRVGEIRQFDFDPLDHVELGKRLGLIDIPRGVKVAGSRSYFLTGPGAMLHWAVLRYAMDFMISQGYCPISPPVLVRDAAMQGTGFYPGGEEQAYQCERDALSLVGTAEVPVTAYHMDEILDADELPKKYVALSSCFRREAGTYGKDTTGVYRIHQFEKVEQVIVCRNDPEHSAQLHEEILANSEAVLQALELPYRIIGVCTGDMGQGKVKQYDVETYMPSRNSYGETHSASRYHDFQARRLNLRYRDAEGKIQVCHTLNDTVVASPRILISILELYQNADGSVTIPKVLQPYMAGREKIEASA